MTKEESEKSIGQVACHLGTLDYDIQNLETKLESKKSMRTAMERRLDRLVKEREALGE